MRRCSEQGEGQSSIPAHKEQEMENRPQIHYLKGGWGGSHELFAGSTLSGYFTRFSGKSKVETCGYNLKLRSSCKTPSVSRVAYCKMTYKQHNVFVLCVFFSSQDLVFCSNPDNRSFQFQEHFSRVKCLNVLTVIKEINKK